jgi:hypothetical protein
LIIVIANLMKTIQKSDLSSKTQIFKRLLNPFLTVPLKMKSKKKKSLKIKIENNSLQVNLPKSKKNKKKK